jgi:hypothetical protein
LALDWHEVSEAFPEQSVLAALGLLAQFRLARSRVAAHSKAARAMISPELAGGYGN